MLADLLLAPAPLPDFTTLRQFTDIFPRGHRDSPAVALLYAELLRLRHHDLDIVRRDISAEVSRSKPLRRAYARERRRIEGPAVAADHNPNLTMLTMEDALVGPATHSSPHTLDTASAEMEKACRALEAQLAEMEAATAAIRADVGDRVGTLSDLRHGRFAPSHGSQDAGDHVLAPLHRLGFVCEEATARTKLLG